jgi:hypothetical protein
MKELKGTSQFDDVIVGEVVAGAGQASGLSIALFILSGIGYNFGDVST